MMKTYRSFVLLGILFPTCNGLELYAEERASSGFHEAITNAMIARSAIIAFDVQIDGAARPKKDIDGDSSRRLERFELRLAFEAPQRRLHVARRNFYVSKDGRPTQDEENGKWHVFVETGDWQLFARAPGDGSVVDYGQTRSARPEFFDPRGLGLAFSGDLRKGTSAEQVFANHLQWTDDFRAKSNGDGKIRFERGMMGDQYYYVIIDTEKDFWPVEMALFQGIDIRQKTELDLVEVDNLWVPANAVVVSSSEKVSLTFHWNSLNRPISDARFAIKELASDYGFRAIDRRLSSR